MPEAEQAWKQALTSAASLLSRMVKENAQAGCFEAGQNVLLYVGPDLFMVHSHLGPAHCLLGWTGYLYRAWGPWDCHISTLGSLINSNIGAKGVSGSPALDNSSSGYEALS